ncbi:NLR family CARD domain-containing protein 3-like isoform X1 [Oncorhynchus nerka]|uniref:NLR family CARD domain-containing protein 3-like isoform X1 n=1 Tax=Oncorhynchus nerka TaxID=8023 RepID=UPI0031B8A55B
MSSVAELLLATLEDLLEVDLKTFKWRLTQDVLEGFPHIPVSQLENADRLDITNTMVETYGPEGAVKISLEILRKMNQNQLSDRLKNQYNEGETTEAAAPSAPVVLEVRVQDKLKSYLKKKYGCIYEGTSKEGDFIYLDQIYTELHVIDGAWGGVRDEHEVIHLESRTLATGETTIEASNIFKPRPDQKKPIRTGLTLGIAGVGKTVSVQKFIHDWAEGKENQDIDFIFPLPFCKINSNMGEKDCSLIELLHQFFTVMGPVKTLGEGSKVLFIFDGLDESRLPLNFNSKVLTDDTKPASLDQLITNLITGELLPSALIWITSRPAAANQIPRQHIHQWTEVQGFNDQQKEKYFTKKISDKNLASRIINHVKSSRSLHIMCHIPVFCWILATVLAKLLDEAGSGDLPKTLTETYLHFLIFQTDRMRAKGNSVGSDNIVLKLGELAFHQLEKGYLIFYEEDLTECGIGVRKASVYSGLCTEIFKVEGRTSQKTVFSFVHLSIQECLAAVYVFLTFINCNKNPLVQQNSSFLRKLRKHQPMMNLLKSAVDKALKSKNGHLDLFLRFLLGLSLESNQTLLQGLLTQTGSSSQTNEEIVEYIKMKIRKNPSPERCINLFHCLSELNDHSLVKEIQRYLSSGSLSAAKLSPALFSALVFVLLTSEEELDVFDLKKYFRSEEGLLRMLPVVKASRTALLNQCNLSKRCCKALGTALISSHLKELELSGNDLQDLGVKLLSAGLQSPQCKLVTLKLSGCQVTEEGCAALASALRSNPSHLRELDLSYNDPGDSGVKLLYAIWEDPHCKLEKLNVDHGRRCRLKSGPQKYACDLTLDPNTAHRTLSLSEENRKVEWTWREQPYSDHPERFEDYEQVLCREGLTGCCYWEVELSGRACIAVTYKGISRRGKGPDSRLGANDKSWNLNSFYDSYSARHNYKRTDIPVPTSRSNRVGVYLDWPAGTLSFYSVSSDTLTHLHTFHSTFTEPVYPGFYVRGDTGTVTLCQVE